jgi:hypothetical protein
MQINADRRDARYTPVRMHDADRRQSETVDDRVPESMRDRSMPAPASAMEARTRTPVRHDRRTTRTFGAASFTS